MKERGIPQFSLVSRGARVQFGIGIASVAVIPILTFWYLSMVVTSGGNINIFEIGTILVLLMGMGFGGFSILRKYPVNIVRLRSYLEKMITGELPQEVRLLEAEDDIAAVERCLNLIVGQLRERLSMLQQEKKELEQQLFQSQKMESLGVMAAGVAHDFNNLLMGLMANVDLLGDQVPADSEAKKNLADMDDLVQRASELTRQMLVYAGRGQFEMAKVELSQLVQEMDQLLKSTLGKKVGLEHKLDGKMPPIEGDPTQLRQVVMNLVLNAAEAMQDGRGTITISTRDFQPQWEDLTGTSVGGRIPDAESVCLEVLDTGRGMDAATRQKVFDPFFSTKPKGRGLGLAVVLGIIMAHKGAILVDSEPGKGTRFRVILPVTQPLD